MVLIARDPRREDHTTCAGGLQLGHDASSPGGLLVVDRAGPRAGDPQQVTAGASDDLQYQGRYADQSPDRSARPPAG